MNLSNVFYVSSFAYNKVPCCCKFRAKVSDEEHGEHGWVHLRQSIHNPNIAVNMQSSVPGGCQTMTRVLRDKYATLTP